MRLTGWTWLICGLLVALVSGYVYLFIPKDGSPNRAMAFFFFIGLIFIITGIVKILFKRVDDKEVFDSVEKSIEKKKESLISVQPSENRQNRIEQQISQMTKTHNVHTHQEQPLQTTQRHTPHHTNTYYHLHQYKGPVTQNASPHAQHPVAHHAVASHAIHNTEHGSKCHKCGNANSGHSNYCHQCGNRLK